MVMTTKSKCFLKLKDGTREVDSFDLYFNEDLNSFQGRATLTLDKISSDKIDKETLLKFNARTFRASGSMSNGTGAIIEGNLDYALDEYKKELQIMKGERLSTFLSAFGIRASAKVNDVAKKSYRYFGKSLKCLVRQFCLDHDFFYIWENGSVMLDKERSKTSRISRVKSYPKKEMERKHNQLRHTSINDVWSLDVVEVAVGDYAVLQKVTGSVTGTVVRIETEISTKTGSRQTLYVAT